MPAAGTRTQQTTGLPRLVDDVGFLLSRASGLAVRSTNTALEQFGLRVRQYSVLLAVAGADGLSQRDVATLLGLDPSQIVALVDDLEERGLVERKPDLADRRARLVQATRQGRKLVLEAERAVREADDHYLGALDAEERVQLGTLLGRLTGLR